MRDNRECETWIGPFRNKPWQLAKSAAARPFACRSDRACGYMVGRWRSGIVPLASLLTCRRFDETDFAPGQLTWLNDGSKHGLYRASLGSTSCQHGEGVEVN
jgi:hypothetical protein